MKISGFSFVRNAVRLQYPVVESILSILPIVDEFIIAVGDGEDDTVGLIKSINSPKIRIVPTQWNALTRAGGYVLAQQTNIALFNCTGHWAIYLQADEAIHERDHAGLLDLMKRYRDDDRVDGLALQRLTFYGDYNTVLNRYPYVNDLTCRVVKPHRFVLSRGDAAGFTVHPKYKEKGRRLRLVDTGLDLFHYYDVRLNQASTDFQAEKGKYWTGAGEVTDYYERMPRSFMATWRGSHPAPMSKRIEQYPYRLDLNSPRWRSKLTRAEWAQEFRSKITTMFGYQGSSARGVVKSHRNHRFHPDIV